MWLPRDVSTKTSLLNEYTITSHWKVVWLDWKSAGISGIPSVECLDLLQVCLIKSHPASTERLHFFRRV